MKSDSKEKQILKNIFLTVDMAPLLDPLLDMIFLSCSNDSFSRFEW